MNKFLKHKDEFNKYISIYDNAKIQISSIIKRNDLTLSEKSNLFDFLNRLQKQCDKKTNELGLLCDHTHKNGDSAIKYITNNKKQVKCCSLCCKIF